MSDISRKITYWVDIVLAVGFGVASAFAIFLFDKIVELSHGFSPSTLGKPMLVLIPSIGGLIVGIIAYFSKINPPGGVVDVIESISVKRVVLGNPKMLLKPALAAVSIISGNPVGSEGPVVILGAQVAAIFGYGIKLPRERRRMLIACGASAGFAAAFLSPLSAIAFSFEVILLEYSTYEFAMLALSAGSAFGFAKIIGMESVLDIPAMSSIAVSDLPWFLVIGITCFGVGFFWISLTKWFEHNVKKLPYASILGPTIAGLAVGIILLFVPQIWGPGYPVMSSLFANPVSIWLALSLLVGKLVGNAMVLGMGGAGGDLAPAMFLGGSIGAVFSSFIGRMNPSLVLAGICAQLSATMHAPLTGILLAVELSGQVIEVMPVMVACAVAALISIKFMPWSIYEEKAKERGLLREKPQFQKPEETLIGEYMDKKFYTFNADGKIKDAIQLMRVHNLQGLTIISEDKLFGLLTLKDLREKVTSENLENKVRGICTTEVNVVNTETTVGSAWKHMKESESGWLFVTAKHNPGKILGVVTKDDLLFAFARKSSRINE